MKFRLLGLLVLVPLALLPPRSTSAQTATVLSSAPPAGSDWQRVQALPIHTYFHVNARTRHSICTLTAVDAESLTCSHDTGIGSKLITFQRTEIKDIKLARRGRSAVLGGVLGASTGAIAGGIQGIGSNYFAVKGAFAMIYAFVGAFAGAPLGYVTDFSASTIYRAP